MKKIILNDIEPSINSTSEQLSEVIIHRLGLMPRKKGSTEKMNKILVELYERTKQSNRDKNPTSAVMTVEEMAAYASITRQTMYEYLRRWLDIDLIEKTSFVGPDTKVVIGYRLNGSTMESAFDKVRVRVNNNLDFTAKYIKELQRVLKNENIRKAVAK